LVSALKKIC